jgi:hypothetical protein
MAIWRWCWIWFFGCKQGRGLSEQRTLVLAALDTIGTVIRYWRLRVLPAEGGPIGAQANEVKNLLANVDTNYRQ